MRFLTNLNFGMYCSRDELKHLDYRVYGMDQFSDIKISPENYSMKAVFEKLPEGWIPDVALFFYPEYYALPDEIENIPCASYAIVSDWNCGFIWLKEVLKKFDHTFTDMNGVDLFKRSGIQSVSDWPVYSFNKAWHFWRQNDEKKYDVTFIGNFNPYIHLERMQMLAKVLTENKGYRVHLAIGIKGEAYGEMLNQSKIVLNRSIRGEFNMRSYEALACRSLLFLEDTNREVFYFLKDRQHCVLYNEQTLMPLIEYYLNHDAEREEIAKNGWQRIQAESYVRHLDQLFNAIDKIPKKYVVRPHLTDETLECFSFYQKLYSFNVHDLGLKYLARQVVNLRKAFPQSAFTRNCFGFINIFFRSLNHSQFEPDHAMNLIRYYTDLIAQFPLHLPAYILLADHLKKKGELDHALKVCETALAVLGQHHPRLEDLSGISELPKNYLSNGFIRAQIDAFLQYYPHDQAKLNFFLIKIWKRRMYEEIGGLYVEKNLPVLAIRHYEMALEACPYGGILRWKLAQLYFQQQDFTEAKVALSKALSENPFNFEIMQEYAAVLFKTGRLEECEVVIEQMEKFISCYHIAGDFKDPLDKGKYQRFCNGLKDLIKGRTEAVAG